MTLKEFVEEHGDDPQGFCPCVIDVQGNLYDCAKGHLEALLKLDGDKKLEDIPSDVSPLFYMLAKTGAIVVDYESQVCSGAISQKQQSTLSSLSRMGMISMNLKDIHGKIKL